MPQPADLCPNCLSPLPAGVTECPECLFALPVAPPAAPPDAAALASAGVTATGRGVASAGDISGTVFTGDIHGSVTVEVTSKLPDIPPPPPPERPPEIPAFVGREAEIEAYSRRLANTHLGIITGMAGVGKTALAAMLVRRSAVPALTFWHTFHADEGVEALIWQIAAFLGFHGQRDLWDLLYRARQGSGQPPPPEVLFNYVLTMLSGKGYLLCLDDFHFVYDQPLFDRLIGAMLKAIRAGELSLIVTSRRVPSFASPGDYDPLAGLSFADTRALLSARSVTIADALVHDLYTTTGGNAQLLILAANALQRSRDPERMVTRLIDAGDIEDYLIREVDRALSAEERAALSAISVLLGYPASREAVESVTNGESLRRVLSDLGRSNLLLVSEGDAGREYRLHAMLQAFYYDLIPKAERIEMHRRAGEFYEKEEPDALKAARHWERAGDPARAVKLLNRDLAIFTNRGEARGLLALLERFQPGQLEPALWATAMLAKGEVSDLLGSPADAREAFTAAMQATEGLPESPGLRLQRARACRGMGASLELSEPQNALDWLIRGLDELGKIDAQMAGRLPAVRLEQAALLVKTGSVRMALGSFTEARAALEQALALLPEGPHALRAGVYTNLAFISGTTGDLLQAGEYTRQGLAIAGQLNDYFRVVSLSNSLGLVQDMSGDWPGAIATYRKALELAERLGSARHQANLAMNLGILYSNLGDWEPAEGSFNRSLEIARRAGFVEIETNTLVNLAQMYLRCGDRGPADDFVTQVGSLAGGAEVRYFLPDYHRLRAELALLAGNGDAALTEAETSLAEAREQGMEPEAAKALRVIGQSLARLERMDEACQRFSESEQMLSDAEPFECARTQLAWGLALLASGDRVESAPLLDHARQTFHHLGALAELAQLPED